jgi:hypothetical protein
MDGKRCDWFIDPTLTLPLAGEGINPTLALPLAGEGI